MKKIVRKWGDSLIVSFNKEDKKIHNIEEGDVIDLSDIIFIKKKKEVEINGKVRKRRSSKTNKGTRVSK